MGGYASASALHSLEYLIQFIAESISAVVKALKLRGYVWTDTLNNAAYAT